MAMSEEEFHAEFERITQEMLQLAYDYVEADERVQVLYIYGGNDAQQLISSQVYYRVADKVCTLAAVDEALGKPKQGKEEWMRVVEPESALMEDLVRLFQKAGRDVPTELRMVYDCVAESMDLDLSYEPFAEDENPMAASRDWFYAIRDGKPALPGH